LLFPSHDRAGNPILSARGSGASTPVGTKADPLENLSINAKELAKADPEIRLKKQQEKTERENTRKEKGKADVAELAGFQAKKTLEAEKEAIRALRANSAKKEADKELKRQRRLLKKDYDDRTKRNLKSKVPEIRERAKGRQRRQKLFYPNK
jgi:ribosome-binding ATPase YchF (GTP1/OBG family)